MTRAVVDEYLHPPNGTLPSDSTSLNPREREVLQLISEGNTSREIAERLHISTRTAEKHRYSLMHKLDIHGVAGLVRYALQQGITKL